MTDHCASNVNFQRSVVIGIAAITMPPARHPARKLLLPSDSSSEYWLSSEVDANSTVVMTLAARDSTLNAVGKHESADLDVKITAATTTDPQAMRRLLWVLVLNAVYAMLQATPTMAV
mmetsp:Transcript_13885/g.23729  ORF Transcript_13885/g.23729 Transcript_13885/m.23729 type:complete len:118 (-) Transcript_13885:105-458(-)